MAGQPGIGVVRVGMSIWSESARTDTGGLGSSIRTVQDQYSRIVLVWLEIYWSSLSNGFERTWQGVVWTVNMVRIGMAQPVDPEGFVLFRLGQSP